MNLATPNATAKNTIPPKAYPKTTNLDHPASTNNSNSATPKTNPKIPTLTNPTTNPRLKLTHLQKSKSSQGPKIKTDMKGQHQEEPIDRRSITHKIKGN